MRLLRKTRDRSLHLTTAAPSALFCVWHSTDIIRSAHCCEPTALWEDDWSQTTVSRQVRCCCIQTLLQLTLHVTTPDTSTDSCSQHSLTEILPFMKTLARGCRWARFAAALTAAPLLRMAAGRQVSERKRRRTETQGLPNDIKWIGGLGELANSYDAFIFDLWGVVHNGKVAFPWAVETLTKLKELRKPVLFLSNSSRRRETNSAALQRLGIGSELYVDLITSGEVSWKILAGSPEADAVKVPPEVRDSKSILTFGNGEDDTKYLQGFLPQRALAAAEEAARGRERDLLLARGCFALCDGTEERSCEMKDFDAPLKVAAARQVPMLVANPDVVRPDGVASPMPGRLARRYKELGGADAFFVGKPYPAVFDLAVQRLQEAGVPADARICMVGDSAWHDVRGARSYGLDVVLLCSGVHSQALGIDQAPAEPRCPLSERLQGFLGALTAEASIITVFLTIFNSTTIIIITFLICRIPFLPKIVNVIVAVFVCRLDVAVEHFALATPRSKLQIPTSIGPFFGQGCVAYPPADAMDTLICATFLCTFPLNSIAACLSATVALFAYGGSTLRSLLLAYFCWMLVDPCPEKGGYSLLWKLGITDCLRRGFFWQWASRYFPVTMRVTAPLPADKGPYIFVCHPHGIIGVSPMTAFGTDACGFSTAFPGLSVHLLGHNAIFRIPFFREWCLMHGHGTVSKKTCLHLLRHGRCIGLAPGGAKETAKDLPSWRSVQAPLWFLSSALGRMTSTPRYSSRRAASVARSRSNFRIAWVLLCRFSAASAGFHSFLGAAPSRHLLVHRCGHQGHGPIRRMSRSTTSTASTAKPWSSCLSSTRRSMAWRMPSSCWCKLSRLSRTPSTMASVTCDENINTNKGHLKECPTYITPALTWETQKVATASEVVLCGLACMDLAQQLETFPEADAKVRALQTAWCGGGNAANTAAALARLGSRARLLTKVGDDALGSSILEGLADQGVDTSGALRAEGRSSTFSTVLVDRSSGTRTCVNSPMEEDMSNADMARLLADEAAASGFFDPCLKPNITKCVTASDYAPYSQTKRAGMTQVVSFRYALLCTPMAGFLHILSWGGLE
eukprot:s3848_g2.t1